MSVAPRYSAAFGGGLGSLVRDLIGEEGEREGELEMGVGG